MFLFSLVLACSKGTPYEVEFSAIDGRYCGVPPIYGHVTLLGAYAESDELHTGKVADDWLMMHQSMESARRCCSEVGAVHVGWRSVRAGSVLLLKYPTYYLTADGVPNSTAPVGEYHVIPLCRT